MNKNLIEDIIHWLELITEILNFLEIFSVKKFNISENLQENQQKNYVSDGSRAIAPNSKSNPNPNRGQLSGHGFWHILDL